MKLVPIKFYGVLYWSDRPTACLVDHQLLGSANVSRTAIQFVCFISGQLSVNSVGANWIFVFLYNPFYYMAALRFAQFPMVLEVSPTQFLV